MKGANWWRHEALNRWIDDIFGLKVKISFEIAADSFNDHFFLIARNCYETSILLKKHDGIEELLFLCGFVNEMIASLEDNVVLNTISKVLNLIGL